MKIKLLIADDHPLIREGIKSVIKDAPFLFIKKEVDNGLDVIKELIINKYDILLLDIALPIKNGFEVLEYIKRKKINIKTIIISIYKDKEYILKSFELGAMGYLTKELFCEELIKAIKFVINGKKYIPTEVAEELTKINFNEKSIKTKLSNREFEVLILIAKGKNLKEISNILKINEKTVSTYRYRILNKLNLKNNAEIIYYAIKNRLIELP